MFCASKQQENIMMVGLACVYEERAHVSRNLETETRERD